MKSRWRTAIRLFTMTGTYVFWIPLLLIWYLISPSDWQFPFMVVQTWNMLVIQSIKRVVKRDRPEFGDFSMGVVKFDLHSFPSGHSGRAAIVMIFMPLLFPDFAWFWILWGLAIMFSRLLLGVHYVSDIVGGFFVGLLSIFPLFFFEFFNPLF